ncbi:MAG: glycosyltransferase family 1 protein [Bacteroidales bacterium]|nr:glycosyltransferase family 1 protein [Bacteroidales bacterium]MCF8327994.1 glycosyltransferase family 1 protein [Bacteroidales bacterium]
MSDKHLHIIAFDIPYPPNYGGVIDVWHKLRTLYQYNVKIHLHCFEYPGRERTDKLEQYCASVNYYKRQLGFKQALSTKPYIIATRKNKDLLQNLLKDNYPVLFEGLHSCYYIDNPKLKGRTKVYRESNIEHRYYYNLFTTSRHLYLKTYYLTESIKLRFFEKKIKHASAAAVVSKADQEELQYRYPDLKVKLIPSFHSHDQLDCKAGAGDYVLYHGNLEVPENENAALYLLNEVFKQYSRKFIIAGMNPTPRLKKAVETIDNAELIANPAQEKMNELIKEAHVNLLVTFQATGLKLKLLNALYRGRFALVNDLMVRGTEFRKLCHIANTPEQIKAKLNELFKTSFKTEDLKGRNALLDEHYSNHSNAEKLLDLIYS